MQAILTTYLPPTNHKPSRIRAKCERGSIIVGFEYAVSRDAAHVYAANRLCEKFVTEDATKYGGDPRKNPWSRKRVSGGLPNGDVAHVFVS